MEDTIKRLREERAMLRLRLDRIEAAISEYERWAASVADLVGVSHVTPVDWPENDERTPLPNLIKHQDERPMSSVQDFQDAVTLILEEAQKPYSRSELREALARMDVVVGGKDPTNTMATRLSRMENVTNIRGHGYWIAGRSYPPADYFPETDSEQPESAEKTGEEPREKQSDTDLL